MFRAIEAVNHLERRMNGCLSTGSVLQDQDAQGW